MKSISASISGFLMAISLLAVPAHADDSDRCLTCHEIGSPKSRLHINGSEFRASVHGKELSCLECHPGAKEDLHTKSTGVRRVNCLECHSEKKNAHGQGRSRVPECHDCHRKHGILPHNDPRSSLSRSQISQTCGECHPNQTTQGTVLSSVLSFRVKGHGKGYLGKEYSRWWCLDCHQGQAAHGEVGPLTDQDCYRCHTRHLQDLVLLGSFHGLASHGGDNLRGALGDALYLLGLAISLGLFGVGVARHVRIWRMGKPDSRWDRPLMRFVGWLRIVLGQKRIFSRPLAGWSHYLIFLGVMLPLAVTIITQVRFSLPALPSAALSILLDFAGVGLLAGVILAFYRRRIHREDFPHGRNSDLAILILLALIPLSGLLVEGLRVAHAGSYSWIWPIGSTLALMLPPSGLASNWAWRVHFLLVLVFLAFIPFTKLRHITNASLTAYFRNLKPRGQLPTIEVSRGNHFGVSSAFDLTWKGLLDADACLSCGRCQEVCPAYQAEKPLSPMKVVRDLKNQAVTYLYRHEKHLAACALVNGWISEEEIWACTTCQACQEACPVLVEHVEKIVGLRRDMVLNRGRVPKEAAGLLRNLEVFGDPEGRGAAHRRDWIPVGHRLDLNMQGNVVLWIGCQGASHPRAGEVARALVRLAERAGEKVRLLAERERCCGDPARRLGAEDVFQDLAHGNIKLLHELGARTVVAFCPHCFNTLANEYPDLGGDFTVISAVQWTLSLLESNRLVVKRSWPGTIVYHDPCYLGRINGQTDGPRRLLRAVPGLELVESTHCRKETFCCGAGGGRLWFNESGIRINQLRAGQCIDTGADHIATACPYCVIMLEDGVAGYENRGKVCTHVFEVNEILEWVTR